MDKEQLNGLCGSGFEDSDWLGSITANLASDFFDSDFSGGDTEGPGLAAVQHIDLAAQDPDGGSHGLDLELNEIEGSIIRVAERQVKKRGRPTATTRSEKTYITHEDFEEGIERDAFLLIYGYAEMLFESSQPELHGALNTLSLKQKRALEFFFCNRATELNFEEAAACIDAEIRVDVLRMRIMYELWLRKSIVGALPSDSVPIPSRVELMAARFGGIAAIQMAQEAWFNPGIEGKALLQMVGGDINSPSYLQAQKALNELVEAYVLSVADTRIYCTGVNPLLELEDRQNDPSVSQRSRLANIYWSRRW